MEFIDLRSQYLSIKENILKRIETVLDHGQYILGPEVNELEKELCTFTGRRYCVTCANGTDALLMALMSLNVKPGDAILTTTFSFIATAEIISLLGARPFFVDVNELTYNIDPADLLVKINQIKTNTEYELRGIITVDLFGLPADYDIIETICNENKLFLIEDAAQSFGAKYKGKKTCSFGDIATTSFFPAKPLGCYGDGGAIFTDKVNLAEKLVSIRSHGKGADKYDNVRIGINGRLDTIQAAILLEKLKILEPEIDKKNDLACYYSEKLDSSLVKPRIKREIDSAWAQYSVRSEYRSFILNYLKEVSVPVMVYYPKPLHLQTAFKYLGYSVGDFPNAEKIANDIFSLPMHAYLQRSDQDLIINFINMALQNCMAM